MITKIHVPQALDVGVTDNEIVDRIVRLNRGGGKKSFKAILDDTIEKVI